MALPVSVTVSLNIRTRSGKETVTLTHYEIVSTQTRAEILHFDCNENMTELRTKKSLSSHRK